MSVLQTANVRVKVRVNGRSSGAPSRVPTIPMTVARPAHWLNSFTTWIMTAVLVYFSAAGTFSFYDPESNTQIGAVTGGGGSTFLSAMIGRFVLIGLCIIAWRYSVQVRKAAFCVPALALLNCMGILSSLWSPEPSFALKQGVYLLVTYTFAIAFVSQPAEMQMKYMQLAGTIALVLTVFTVALFPQFGLNGRQGMTGEWEGIYAGKNVCAMAIIFLMMPALYRKPAALRGRILRIVYIFAMLAVIGMTRSRTGWVIAALLIAFSFGLKLLARFKSFDRLVLFILLSCATLAIGTLILLNLDSLFHFIGRDLTFSGRIPIWTAILHSIAQRPWTGYGYRTFWRGMTGESANVMIAIGWMMSYAHDGFLSVWLEVGAFGLLLLIVCLLKGLKDSLYCLLREPSPQVLWYITIVVFGILYNIDEATFLFRYQLMWVAVIAAIVGLDRKRRQLRRSAAMLVVRR
jgi:O-antigen ligase